MRIGISCHPTYGGSGALATQLGVALADRGHEVHFLSYARPARLADFHPNISFHEARVSSYPLFRYPPYDLALASVMREVSEVHRLDVMHVHYAIPHAISAILSRAMLGGGGPRIVTTLHGTDITIVGADGAYFHPTRYGIESSDAVTTVSNWLRDESLRIFQPDRAIRVVHNFVDTDRFRPHDCVDTRRGLGSDDEVVLAHVSNFRPVKRLADVVRIFARVSRAMPARLVLAGDGPERPRAEKVARDEGVFERVRFLGEQEAVERVLGCSDLFLLPSDHESFGLAALEAMSCAVPVLGTRSGGLPEVVDDEVTGLLVDVGDVETAARRSIALLQDPARRRAMGAEARRRAVDRFAEEDVVSQYEALYGEVLDAPLGPARGDPARGDPARSDSGPSDPDQASS